MVRLGVHTHFAEVAGFDSDLYGAGEPARFDAQGASTDCRLAWAHDWMSGDDARAWAEARGLPLVLHLHSTARERAAGRAEWIDPRTFEREGEVARCATRVVCVSDRTAQIALEDYDLDPSRLRVVHNGLDGLHASAFHEQPGQRGPRDLSVTFLGRFDWQKGPERFLAVIDRLARRDPDLRFAMAGDGPLRPLVQARLQALGLARRVLLPGWLRAPERDALLSRSRVCLVPSAAEPFGLVALEALRCGALPLVDASAGVREAFPACPAVDTSKPAAAAGAALDLLALEDRAVRELGRALATQAAATSWSRSAVCFVDVLREVLDR